MEVYFNHVALALYPNNGECEIPSDNARALDWLSDDELDALLLVA